jgi:hypothetical protein
MRRGHLSTSAVAIATSLGLAACGGAATGEVKARAATTLAHWTPSVSLDRPLDIGGPRQDGSMVVAAGGRLSLLSRSGRLVPFAPAYRSPAGEEPYIALSGGGPRGCSFGRDVVYALRLGSVHGVVRLAPGGRAELLARLTAPGLIDGIAFDRTGHFGHRLLVTVNAGSRTTVDAIDCRGRVTTITRAAPRVEGGIAVAPAGFGRYAGDLIAPDETGGRIFAIAPSGQTALLAISGLPHGPDIGVESEGFLPAGSRQEALLADRLTPHNRHPGDDVILRVTHAALSRAGVRAGDLLVATEGGAKTDAIRCRGAGCQVRHVADGPAIAHSEGHIAFAAAG